MLGAKEATQRLKVNEWEGEGNKVWKEIARMVVNKESKKQAGKL